MSEPRTPQGDIPYLYASAANGDKASALKLIGLYNDYITIVARNLQSKYGVHVAMEDLAQEGACGLLSSLKNFDLISGHAPYAAWIEKNIKAAIARRIYDELKARGVERVPDEL